MTLEKRAEMAAQAWVDHGRVRDKIRMEFLYVLCRALVPTPALGFMLGGFTTAAMTWFAAQLLEQRPFVAAILIGVEVAGLGWIWQRIYDRYWRAQ